MTRALRAGLATAALAVAACAPAVAPPRREATKDATSWVVIAPHPDDAALTAGGVLARAVAAGQSVAVIVMTNGDYDCVNDGLRREAESVAGLGALGVPEDRVFFLGYPDGALAKLGLAPLAARRLEHGRCVSGQTTYGDRGPGGNDYHDVRFGMPASYTRAAAVFDLASLLSELRPTDVIVTHGADTHPDHAATYALFRSAVDRLPRAPRVHRAMVHNGDCWPTGAEPREPCPAGTPAVATPMPPLTGRLAGYVARERIPAPASCRDPDRRANLKVRAIAAHASQTRGDDASYLFSFARADEAFYPETFRREGRRWNKAAAAGALNAPSTLLLTPADARPIAPTRALAVALPLPDPALQRTGPERPVVTLTLGGAGSGYRLDVDRERAEAVLARTAASGDGAVLETWPLPFDLWAAAGAVEEVALVLDPRPEDGVTELALRVRGELAGVAVDPAPELLVTSIGIAGAVPPAGVDAVVRVSAFPSARPAR